MTQNKSKVYSVLRIFLPVLVLLGHVFIMYTSDGALPPKVGSFVFEKLARYIYSFHMPLFMALSGALWGYQVNIGKYRNILFFIKNKAVKLLIPYLFFGICIVSPVMVILRLTDLSLPKYIYRYIILSQNPRHLWYVLALFLIFVIAALVRPFWEKISIYLMLPLSFALVILSQLTPNIGFQINAALNYQFFFFLGAYIDKYWDLIFTVYKKFKFLPFVLIFALLLRFILPYNLITRFSYNIIGVLMAFGIPAVLSSEKLCSLPFFKKLEKNGFGIYLFHPMIIYFIFYGFSGTDISPYILVPTAVIVSSVLSYFLTELFRKWHLGILIGE